MPTPIAACRSSPAGAVPCSRSSCRTSSCPRRTGRRAAGGSTTRSTCAPSASTASIEASYGYWGFSPSSNPAGGYREYGVDALGLNPDGYFSDQEKTNYDVGFGTCRPATNPNPTYGDGVVTPHASFLAMMFERGEATANLIRIQKQLGAYGGGGFFDAVAVRRHDRPALPLARPGDGHGRLGNVLGKDVLRRAFSTPDVETALRPVIGIEEFGAGPVAG